MTEELTNDERKRLDKFMVTVLCECGHHRGEHHKFIDCLFVGCNHDGCNCQGFKWPNDEKTSSMWLWYVIQRKNHEKLILGINNNRDPLEGLDTKDWRVFAGPFTSSDQASAVLTIEEKSNQPLLFPFIKEKK